MQRQIRSDILFASNVVQLDTHSDNDPSRSLRGRISLIVHNVLPFLAERYYVTFGLRHGLSVCRLSIVCL